MNLIGYYITFSIFIVSLILSLLYLKNRTNFKYYFKNDKIYLLILFVLMIFIRFPYRNYIFHGLEYEDCFVHQASSNYNQKIPTETNMFRESTPSFGNAKSGDYSQTVFNYIGYPTTIRIFKSIIGNSIIAGNIVSLIAYCFSFIIIYLLAIKVNISSMFPIISVFVYTTIPNGIIYSSTTSADVLSSFFIILSIYISCLIVEDISSNRKFILGFFCYISVVSFAILVKRENIILLTTLVFQFFGLKLKDIKYKLHIKIILILSIFLFIYIFSFYVLDISTAIKEETIDSNGEMISLHNLISLGPVYIKALFNIKYYFIWGAFLVLFPLIFFKNILIRPVIYLFFTYLLVHSSHYRSYYYLLNYTINTNETIRYMIALLPLLSLISAACIFYILKIFHHAISKHIKNKSIYILTIIFIITSIIGVDRKNELIKEEQSIYIEPVKSIIEKFDNDIENTWIFTLKPNIFQIYSEDINIVDIAIIDKIDRKKLENIIEKYKYYLFLSIPDREVNSIKRYNKQFETMASLRKFKE